jgi:hypothetical protein
VEITPNSAIDELIPARFRGRIDIIVNGSFWLGAALGSGASLLFLDPRLLAPNIGWRVGFAVGGLLRLVYGLEVLGDELWTAEEAIGQPVSTYQDPLVERLRRVRISDQKIEDFSAWMRTISSLISIDLRDENQLAKIVAAEATGLKLLADLVASLRNGNHQGREKAVLSEANAA